MPATLILTIALTVPNLFKPDPVEMRFAMPSLERCEEKGNELLRGNDDSRHYEFRCEMGT